MAIEYVKKAAKTPATGEDETRKIVSAMLDEIRTGGEEAARAYGRKLDGWDGEVHMVGDCLAPRTAEEAVLDGLKVASAI